MTAIAAFLLSCVVALGLRMVGQDVQAWLPRLRARILRRAAKPLEPNDRDRYLREWEAEIATQPDGPLTRLLHALRIFFGRHRLAAEIAGDVFVPLTHRIVAGVVLFAYAPAWIPAIIAAKFLGRGHAVFYRKVTPTGIRTRMLVAKTGSRLARCVAVLAYPLLWGLDVIEGRARLSDFPAYVLLSVREFRRWPDLD